MSMRISIFLARPSTSEERHICVQIKKPKQYRVMHIKDSRKKKMKEAKVNPVGLEMHSKRHGMNLDPGRTYDVDLR